MECNYYRLGFRKILEGRLNDTPTADHYAADFCTNCCSPQNHSDSGTCGRYSGVKWFFTEDGTLCICGISAIPDYANALSAPWSDDYCYDPEEETTLN